jgi:hypothetical protein
MKRYSTLLAAAAVLAGCSTSGPSNSTNIAGTWTLTSTNLTGGGNSCSLTGQMQITQSGNSLGGNLPGNGVQVNCTNYSGSSMAQSAGTNLVSGSISLTVVALDLDNGSVQAAGTVTGTGAMSGPTISVNYPASQINVTGSWSATKNP